MYNNATGTWQSQQDDVVWNNVQWSPELSVATDATYGTHVAIRMQNGTIEYAYRPSQGQWSVTGDIFSGQAQNATLTMDYSTGTIYAFAIKASSIVMKKILPGESWKNVQSFSPVSNRNNPINLESNLVSISASSSNTVMMLWTENSGSSYAAMFASIPIPTNWSPYAFPSDPWDGNGVAPYGQYFTNLQESVSPSSGMLTIQQSDLSLAGRGIDLSITRVYTEPHGFLSGPYGYESYPWAPLGNGWQLNFPWMSTVQNASYIHLWNGEGYEIPSSFWGASPVFENDVGEHFRMVRNSTGVYLYPPSGVAYTFDQGSPNRLLKITDPIGNTIAMAYSNNLISTITDTIGRLFVFCYNNSGLLQSINQTAGNWNCKGSGWSVRAVKYAYFGSDLIKAWDPAGRLTTYGYSAVPDLNAVNWLISNVTYPTRWYTNFTYTPFRLGTEATTYRTHIQLVRTSSNAPIRQLNYTYTSGPGDQVNNSTIITYNSTYAGGWQLQPVSYASYNFSTAKVYWMIYNSAHQLVTGHEQVFGVHGEILQDVTFTTDGGNPPKLGSYTDYYQYDKWGNQIYTRRVISPSANWYHESYSAYYNNGLPPGFYAFEENFGRNEGTAWNNPWNVKKGSWLVQDYAFNGTGINGRQQDMLAWTDVGERSISVQARVKVTNEVNQTYPTSVGIFTNFVNSTDYREELVLMDQGPGLSTLLVLIDPQTNSASWTSCPIAYGSWYTFNMTSNGGTVTGWAGTQGNTCTVTTNVDAIGTSFGIYAGGFSALFTNVTAARVSPMISPVSFSNSFFKDGAPNRNIHTALAGTAELQNGTGSAPIETYYSYYPWGGLNQSKQLYSGPIAAYSSPHPQDFLTFGPTGYTGIAQQFVNKPSISYVYQATFVLEKTGAPSGAIYAEIWTASSSWTMTGKSTAIDASTLTSAMSTYTFVFQIPVELVASGAYYVALDLSNVQLSSSNLVNAQDDPTFSRWGLYACCPWGGPYSLGLTLSFAVFEKEWISSSYNYDSFGNMRNSTDPKGSTVYFSFSTNYQSAYLTNQTSILGSHTKISRLYGYDPALGTLLWSVDPNGYNTTYAYDILGRLTRVVYPNKLGNVTYTYNDAGTTST